jgi:hypothetical protein
MFGLFTRSRTKINPGARRRSAPLMLERLETRDCPSGGGPLIMSLGIHATNVGKQVEICGTVEDQIDPGSVSLNFSGVANGQVWTNPVGAFDYTTTATGLGSITAIAVNSDGEASWPGTATLAVPAPTLWLNVTYGTQRNVTLSGTVFAGQPGGLTVGFSGKVSGSTTTNSSGNFTLSAQASALGTVTGTVTDVWGQTGTSQVTLTSNKPVIDSFSATGGGSNVWIFQGHVSDESPAGLTVRFGGLPELQGKTATVQSDGTFWIGAQLTRGEYGTATAQVTDWWGLNSDVVFFLVMN